MPNRVEKAREQQQVRFAGTEIAQQRRYAAGTGAETVTQVHMAEALQYRPKLELM